MPSRNRPCHRMPAVATVALAATVIAVHATAAHAQPGLTQPGPVAPIPGAEVVAPEPPTLRDPDTARLLSLAGTVLPLGMFVVGITRDDASSEGLVTLGLLGTVVGPLAGHWYAGKAGTKGLAARLAAMAGGLLGASLMINCSIDGCSNEALGPALLIGGVAAYLGGIYSDVATADDSARAYNAAHATPRPSLSVAPHVAPDGRGGMLGGLTLAGSY
jgi:hypothetical protein